MKKVVSYVMESWHVNIINATVSLLVVKVVVYKSYACTSAKNILSRKPGLGINENEMLMNGLCIQCNSCRLSVRRMLKFWQSDDVNGLQCLVQTNLCGLLWYIVLR